MIKSYSIVKSIDQKKGIVRFRFTDKTLDRDSEVILPGSMNLNNFKKNPVHLWLHGYDERGLLPIGKTPVDSIEQTENYIDADVQYRIEKDSKGKPLDEFAYNIFKMYADGYLNTVSVGFCGTPSMNESDRIYTDQRGATWTKTELFECSSVPIPANPNAAADGKNLISSITNQKIYDYGGLNAFIKLKAEEKNKQNDSAVVQTLIFNKEVFKEEEDVREWIKEHDFKISDNPGIDETEGTWRVRQRDPEDFEENSFRTIEITDGVQAVIGKLKDDKSIKTVIPFKTWPLEPEDTEWDAAKEIAKADIKDLKIMSTWYDSENEEIKSAYKLPHHRASDYHTIWRAVSAAMATLLGARGGVDIPDNERKGVYNHLKKHYDEFEKEAPEFKTLEQIKNESIHSILSDTDVKAINELIEKLNNIININKKIKEGGNQEINFFELSDDEQKKLIREFININK